MGIFNATPDSFHAPSRYNRDVFGSGADIVDIGACSTRPGSVPISEEEEWARLEPVLASIPHTGELISIDTFRASIAAKACESIGPVIVNDVSGASDPDMLPLVRRLGLRYVATHPGRGNSIRDIYGYFRDFSERLQGIDWILDPGFGFGKDKEENLDILHNLGMFKDFGREILAGVSMKRMTGGSAEGTREAQAEALRNGAGILRVHDVKDALETVRLYSSTI